MSNENVWPAERERLMEQIVALRNYVARLEKAALATPSPSGEINAVAERNSLVLIRNAIVLAIAFLGRDSGTDRSEHTTPQIIKMLSNADGEVRRLIDTPSGDQTREALEVLAADNSHLIDLIEDVIETLESMDLHTDNPLYERLRAALTEAKP